MKSELLADWLIADSTSGSKWFKLAKARTQSIDLALSLEPIGYAFAGLGKRFNNSSCPARPKKAIAMAIDPEFSIGTVL